MIQTHQVFTILIIIIILVHNLKRKKFDVNENFFNLQDIYY